MRYLTSENPYIYGRFTTGDTVTITIYLSSDDSVVVSSASMTEVASTGFFKYLFNPSPSSLTEYFYVMNNSIEEHAGKIVLGGYPNDIKAKTDNLPTDPADQSDVETAITSAVTSIKGSDGDDLKDISDQIDTVQTDLDNPNQYKADVSALATEANATTNTNTVVTQVNANETKIDSIISTLSTLVSDIWSAVTRTLTAGTKDTEIDAIKSQTDQISFIGGDIVATLDGETVSLDTATENMLKYILGLVQSNYRLYDTTYQTINSINRLSSATIRTFNNSADCTNNVNPLKEYTMVVTYNASGDITDYQIKEV